MGFVKSSLLPLLLSYFSLLFFSWHLKWKGKLEEKTLMGFTKSSLKSSPKKKTLSLKNLFDLDSPRNGASKLSRNKSFPKKDSSDSDTKEIFSLISHCSFIYTFTDPKESLSQQDLKRLKLIQLLSIIKSSKQPFGSDILSSLFIMLSADLFRPLPPSTDSIICILPDDEEVAATQAATWPHLEIAYDILLRLLAKTEPKVLRDYIDHSFLLNLLSLFRSERRSGRKEGNCVKIRDFVVFSDIEPLEKGI